MSLYILDSDHLSLLQRGNDSIRKKLETVLLKHDIAITIVSVEELLRGRLVQISRAKKVEARVVAFYWLKETLEHLCQFTVIGYSEEAEKLVNLWQSQKIRVGSQDLRIAGISLVHSATLVTRNQRDFAQIPSLMIENWV